MQLAMTSHLQMMTWDIYPLYGPSPEGYIQETISWNETYILCTVQAPKATYRQPLHGTRHISSVWSKPQRLCTENHLVHISLGWKTHTWAELTCELPQSRH